ncbi:hypothetical protein [Aquimarina algiphila]|uniref:Zona occludens toxin N-terminal domain-containing protein n=1 Tax=Aquimarina algiphila TaxID=2047982 RepID=A0A554VB98_9FLAO|nr:hypothetical protein [Aquimarina algiphila]TSE03686.1 hypothetical protein FOF46_28725 [Aquimarina algiphila]
MNYKRKNELIVVIGETGVGKTYRTLQEIKYYLKDNTDTGKKARKVLVFDTNDDDFVQFRSVSPENIIKLTHPIPRRIRPYNDRGRRMDKTEKKEVVKKILNHYQDGLLVLDDMDDYMTFEKGQDMVSALITLRHRGVDFIFSHQSLGKVAKTAWQNASWLRLHHQVDNPKDYKDRIPKYPLVRIAQHIVEEQYELAYRKFKEGEISDFEFKYRSSFFVYVNIRKQRIIGCSRAAFIRAAKKFIEQEQEGQIRMLLKETHFKNNQPIYKNRNEALIKLIADYLRYHETVKTIPFNQHNAA